MHFHENFHEFVLVGISGITIGNFKRFEFGRENGTNNDVRTLISLITVEVGINVKGVQKLQNQ